MTIRAFLGGGSSLQSVPPEPVASDYVDVISYVGNNSTQNLTTSVNLDNGYLMMFVNRNNTSGKAVVDSVRGLGQYLQLALAGNAITNSPAVSAASGNTISLTSSAVVNSSGTGYIATIFKKDPAFLDIVTWTGNGASSRTISHSLTKRPSFVLIKKYSGSGGTEQYVTLYDCNIGIYPLPSGVGRLSNQNFDYGPGAQPVNNFIGGGSGAISYFFSNEGFYGSGPQTGGNAGVGGGGGGGARDSIGGFAQGGNGGPGAVVVEYGEKCQTFIGGMGHPTSWSIPAGITSVKVWVIGAGGGGYGGGASINGGGGGGAVAWKTYSVTPGETATFSFGVGGTGSLTNGTPATNGTATSFTYGGVTITAAGGSAASSSPGVGGVFSSPNADGGADGGNGIQGITVDNSAALGYLQYQYKSGGGGSIGGGVGQTSNEVCTGGAPNDVGGLFAALKKQTRVINQFDAITNGIISTVSSGYISDIFNTDFTITGGSILNINGASYVAYLFAELDDVMKVTCAPFTAWNRYAGTQQSYSPLDFEPLSIFSRTASVFYTGVGLTLSNKISGITHLNSTIQGKFISLSGTTGENGGSVGRPVNAYDNFGIASGLSSSSPPQAMSFFDVCVSFKNTKSVVSSKTDFFNVGQYVGNNSQNREIVTTMKPELIMVKAVNANYAFNIATYQSAGSFTYSTAALLMISIANSPFDNPNLEVGTYANAFTNNSFGVSYDGTYNTNTNGVTYTWYALRKLPGAFTFNFHIGNGLNNRQVKHDLGVVPEMILIKGANTSYNYMIMYHKDLPSGHFAYVGASSTTANDATAFTTSAPTSSYFLTGTSQFTNSTVGQRQYFSLLFATLPGFTKVGSYTGNGSSDRNIDCGFSAGARFVFIKPENSTTTYVFDTATGIASGNDSMLQFNQALAAVTGTNYIDIVAEGFKIQNSVINGNGTKYYFLAIA